ncbi:branched-chain amino acid ABC transporter ATP-binding protein/permease [Ponticoccus alexandrii]|uniref:ATP-binding cassette domain-containing protein n=1 Tax=Ponticoccus alexandrii TaxID=1943633 RepID=A0ABX7FGR3_9RHOB|nr:branched-chain amino acid ABC transporter ATP-binding protein/permease [Ponticoccus alexandrii]KID12384.1 ABC transporter [Rhodobacteraceae bacterium PD-2]QRF69112.1 ATP-binding cassette domain-containing protein [Ponticoccus alexandrii]
MIRIHPLLIAAAALVALPFIIIAAGLTYTSATEVVVYGLACMGLNILAGRTGLVSFGHGAWFGLGAYLAGLTSLAMGGAFFVPLLVAVIATAVIATGFGALILRRRGVYFSLMTLALSALGFSIAFRWTEVTGGENGLGGIERPAFAGVDFSMSQPYYWLVALIAFAIMVLLWRFNNSPLGTVLLAIRENEQRARFLGYKVDRYKLAAFVLSATITALAGVLLLYKNRMTSAEPMSVIFSGELLAMVVIGGMRSYLGPALGALFYILFREYLSIYTDNWLLWFGLVFMGFVLFAREGLIGIPGQIRRYLNPPAETGAAMAGRKAGVHPLPDFLKPAQHSDGALLEAKGISKAFGGLKAVNAVDISVRDRSLHALIGPNGAGKTTAFNLMSGLYKPDAGSVTLMGQPLSGRTPEEISAAGIGRSFQITNLFPSLTVQENIRLAVQAGDAQRMNPLIRARTLDQVNARTAQIMEYAGLSGMEDAEAASLSYGGQRLLDLGLALGNHPRILLADEPLAGLSVAERERIGHLLKALSADIPVLLVEHDIDRVFELADHVTVMNEGEVLLDGTVADARGDKRVQEVYIGSGTSAVVGKDRTSAVQDKVLLALDKVNVSYGKSHIIHDVSFDLRQGEILALLGRNGAGKSTLLKALIGIAPVSSGEIRLDGTPIHGLSSAAMARAGISYVPQGRGLFAGMSVRDNLELGRIRRQTGAGIHWDEERILSYFPRLKERIDTPADYLSGGEQQMAAVARALSGDTRVLLLDEPFEGLSPAIVEQLFETFDRLREEVSIIIVDHNLDLALTLSDRTVALERGSIIHDGPSAALAHDIDLRRQVLWL